MRHISGRIVLVAAAFLHSLGPCAAEPPKPFELPIWPGVASGSEGIDRPEKWEERGKDGVVDRAVRQVHRPTITVFLPEPASTTGLAVLIAPGGGYEHVTIDKEGHDVARWLAAHGILGVVLKYRLPKTPGASYTAETSLADAEQALKVTREHASEWGISSAKIGMMGFSAGGNLTVLAGTKIPSSQRPVFLGLLYSSIPDSLESTSGDAPPTFIVQAVDDTMGTDNSLRMYQWLHAKNITVELHLFSSGAHGFGLGKRGTPSAAWPELFIGWLTANSFLRAL